MTASNSIPYDDFRRQLFLSRTEIIKRVILEILLIALKRRLLA